jgi:hypothetical protein
MKKISTFFILLIISSFLFAQDEDNYVQGTSPESINESIYNNDTVVWFGSDFSLFRLSNQKKFGQEERVHPFIYAWIEYYKASISNVKIANWISAKKVFNDKTFTDESYKNFLPKQFIVNEKHVISKSDIETHLKEYSSEHKGVGLVFIIECLHKSDPSMVQGYFVWFDIESKKILHIFDVEGGATTFRLVKLVIIDDDKMPKRGKGMIDYWTQGMINATVHFATDYKNLNPHK